MLEFLIKFDSFAYIKLRSVSTQFRKQVAQCIDDVSNSVENRFVQNYSSILFFKRAFTWCKAIRVCGQKGLRID